MCVLLKVFIVYIMRKFEVIYKELCVIVKVKGIYLRWVLEGILYGYLCNLMMEMLKFIEYCFLSIIVICNGS